MKASDLDRSIDRTRDDATPAPRAAPTFTRTLMRKASPTNPLRQFNDNVEASMGFADAMNAGIHDGRIQRDDTGDMAAGSDALVARASGGGGHAIPDGLRSRFESSLNTDLGGVRVHTDDAAAAASHALGARAYAIGQDVFMGPGQYAPETDAGAHLLAHEVAHTVQQRTASAGPQTKLQVSVPGDTLETEADVAASAMLAGNSFAVSSASRVARSIQRDSVEDQSGGPDLDGRGVVSAIRLEHSLQNAQFIIDDLSRRPGGEPSAIIEVSYPFFRRSFSVRAAALPTVVAAATARLAEIRAEMSPQRTDGPAANEGPTCTPRNDDNSPAHATPAAIAAEGAAPAAVAPSARGRLEVAPGAAPHGFRRASTINQRFESQARNLNIAIGGGFWLADATVQAQMTGDVHEPVAGHHGTSGPSVEPSSLPVAGAGAEQVVSARSTGRVREDGSGASSVGADAKASSAWHAISDGLLASHTGAGQIGVENGQLTARIDAGLRIFSDRIGRFNFTVSPIEWTTSGVRFGNIRIALQNRSVRFRYHHEDGSYVEGVLACQGEVRIEYRRPTMPTRATNATEERPGSPAEGADETLASSAAEPATVDAASAPSRPSPEVTTPSAATDSLASAGSSEGATTAVRTAEVATEGADASRLARLGRGVAGVARSAAVVGRMALEAIPEAIAMEVLTRIAFAAFEGWRRSQEMFDNMEEESRRRIALSENVGDNFHGFAADYLRVLRGEPVSNGREAGKATHAAQAQIGVWQRQGYSVAEIHENAHDPGMPGRVFEALAPAFRRGGDDLAIRVAARWPRCPGLERPGCDDFAHGFRARIENVRERLNHLQPSATPNEEPPVPMPTNLRP